MPQPEVRLLTVNEVEEIRQGVKDGIRGPVMLKWVELLLIDHDVRVRREQERLIASVPSPSQPDDGQIDTEKTREG